GVDVRGVVLDADGRRVSDATVWLQIDINGPLGPADEIARSAIDGSFFIRSASPQASVFATAGGLGSSDATPLSDLADADLRARVDDERMAGLPPDKRSV